MFCADMVGPTTARLFPSGVVITNTWQDTWYLERSMYVSDCCKSLPAHDAQLGPSGKPYKETRKALHAFPILIYTPLKTTGQTTSPLERRDNLNGDFIVALMREVLGTVGELAMQLLLDFTLHSIISPTACECRAFADACA